MFYLKIPHFYEQIHVALKPSLAMHAFAIQHKGVVWIASERSERHGITAGMSIQAAQKQLPHLVLVKKRSSQYVRFNIQLLKIIRHICKPVQMVSHGAYYLSAEISEHHVEYLAKKLRRAIFLDLELQTHIGYGHSQAVAYAAAQLATSANPLVTVLSQNIQTIQQLPCSCLSGIGKRTALMLFGMGIKTIKDFASLPIGFVSLLFGEKGKTLHNLANGTPMAIQEPLQPAIKNFFSYGQQAAF